MPASNRTFTPGDIVSYVFQGYDANPEQKQTFYYIHLVTSEGEVEAYVQLNNLRDGLLTVETDLALSVMPLTNHVDHVDPIPQIGSYRHVRDLPTTVATRLQLWLDERAQ